MRPTRILKTLMTIATLSLGAVVPNTPNLYAREPIVWSYSMEQLYERARAMKQVSEGKYDDDNLVEQAILAAEFKGFVAAALDMHVNTESHQAMQTCARRFTTNGIAYAVAMDVTSRPLDRAHLPIGHVLISLQYRCNAAMDKERNEK